MKSSICIAFIFFIYLYGSHASEHGPLGGYLDRDDQNDFRQLNGISPSVGLDHQPQESIGDLYSSTTGSLYRFHPECRTYTEARQACLDEGGDLVIINSEEEAEELEKLILKYINVLQPLTCYDGEYFIGAHYDQKKLDFLTTEGDTLQEAGFVKWRKGEPNNSTVHPGGEECVTMYSNTELNDFNCGQVRPFVCEIYGDLYSNTTGSLYRLHRECRAYTEARQTCLDQGGDLVIINSQEEADELEKLIKKHPGQKQLLPKCCNGEIYIGVHYDQDKLDFLTTKGDTLQEAGFENWAKGEPNNSTVSSSEGEQCVAMYGDTKFNDVKCREKRVFVCEIYGYVYNEESDSIYKVHTRKTNWSEANRSCKRQGGHLAKVNNDEERRIIGRLLIDNLDNNIDNSTDSGAFVTINDKCSVAQGDGTFTDVNCGEDQPFICERHHFYL